jgi:hypothetical protein
MKTANVKVRLKDLKQGVTIYISHPVYGIDKLLVASKPYYSSVTGSSFFKTIKRYDWGLYEGRYSTKDAGICCENTYNGRRTFFKLKHAEEWQRKSLKDPKFLAIHARHEEMNRYMDEMDRYYDYDDRHSDQEGFLTHDCGSRGTTTKEEMQIFEGIVMRPRISPIAMEPYDPWEDEDRHDWDD